MNGHRDNDHSAAVIHDEVKALFAPIWRRIAKVAGEGADDPSSDAGAGKGLNEPAFAGVRFKRLEEEAFLHEVEVIDAVREHFLINGQCLGNCPFQFRGIQPPFNCVHRPRRGIAGFWRQD